MLKFILVGVIVFLIYRFWDNKPAIESPKQEPEQSGYAEYEEVE